MEFDDDVAAQRPARELAGLADDLIEIENCAALVRDAAERKELLCDFGGADGGDVNFLQVVAQRRFGRGLAQNQAGVAADGLQQIVKIVRNAGRKRADDFHFLRLEKMILQFVMLRLVGDVADQSARLSAVDPRRNFHEPVPAVGALKMIFLRHAGDEHLLEFKAKLVTARGVGHAVEQRAADLRPALEANAAVFGGQATPAVVGVGDAKLAVEGCKSRRQATAKCCGRNRVRRAARPAIVCGR